MNPIRNILALIGLVVLVAGVAVGARLAYVYPRVAGLDPQAPAVYLRMAKTLFATGSAAEAVSWRFRVAEGRTPMVVEQAMKAAAAERRIEEIGEIPVSDQVQRLAAGVPNRFLKVYTFCGALVAARMLAYQHGYAAYLPCQVALVQDREGKLWLYCQNLDFLIHGGAELPRGLKAEALQIKATILEILKRGAGGTLERA